MTSKHIVFVDSTLAGLLAFKVAKILGHTVTFIHPQDSSFLEITTKDETKIGPHLANLDFYVKVPSLSGGGLLEQLRLIHGKTPIDAVVTTSEAAILQVAEAAEILGLRSPGHAALKRAVFKNDCRIALKQAGVRSPKFEVLSEEELIQNGPQVVEIPFVVKPTRGFGKQFSAVCKTQADFELFVSTLRAARLATDPMINLIVNSEYIVEQYVQGTLHSAEVVVRGGKVEFFATTTRYRAHFNDLLEMGYSMPAGLPETKRRELHRYLQDVFSALGLVFGLYHVEVILAKDGPYLVEINGRMMGGVGPQVYQALSERNAFELLLQLHLDEDIQVDEKLIKGAGTVVLMGAREEGVIDENFTQSKLNSLLGRYGISFCTLNLQAGQHVRKFEGNLSALGHVIVQGADQISSAKKGHEFLLELDTLLGLELAKYYKLEEADIPV